MPLAFLQAALALVAAAPQQPPGDLGFSWDTVPYAVQCHNFSGPLNDKIVDCKLARVIMPGYIQIFGANRTAWARGCHVSPHAITRDALHVSCPPTHARPSPSLFICVQLQDMAHSSIAIIGSQQCQHCAPNNSGGETKQAAAARQVRSANPNATILMYSTSDTIRNCEDRGTSLRPHEAP